MVLCGVSVPALGADEAGFRPLSAPEFSQLPAPGGAGFAPQVAQPVKASGRRPGAPLRLVPWAEAEVYVSDNIDLAPKGKEKSGTAASVTAGASLDYAGPRLNAVATAGVTAGYQFNGGETSVAPFGEAAGTAELVRKHLFVDADADWQQTYAGNRVSRFSDNHDGVGQVTVSPYWQQRLARNLVGELRYTHQQLVSTDDSVPEGYSDGGRAILEYGTRRTGVEALADYERYRSGETLGDYQTATGMVTGRYGVAPHLSLLARGGYDRVIAKQLPDVSSPIAMAGFDWYPSERTDVNALAGYRYSDVALEANARHVVNRALVMGASVQQQVVSGAQSGFYDASLSGTGGTDLNSRIEAGNMGTVDAARQLESLSDDGAPNLDPSGSSRFYGQRDDNRPYVSTLSTAYVGGALGRKVTYNVEGSAEHRKFDRDSDNVYSAGGAVAYAFAPRWIASSDLLLQTFGKGGPEYDGYLWTAGAGVEYQLVKGADVSLRLTRSQRGGTDAAYRYAEDAAILGVRASF